jgi:hypothetical protein
VISHVPSVAREVPVKDINPYIMVLVHFLITGLD